jgi:hypothetical protein
MPDDSQQSLNVIDDNCDRLIESIEGKLKAESSVENLSTIRCTLS